jgi:hypothetical protein
MHRLAILFAIIAVPSFALAQDEWPDVSGRWAQKQVTTSVSDIPIVGEIETRTIAYLLVDIEQEGSALEVTSKVCTISIDSDIKKVRSVVPEAMIDAIGTTTKKARLERTRDGKVRFFQPRSTDVLGVKLDSIKEPLPTDAEDSRVVDADKDGKPGVTVRIEGLIDGAVYVIQRSWSILRGLATDDQIDGAVTWRTEQVVLDATSSLLNSNPDARPHANRDRHYFRTTRVGSQTDCSNIIKARKRLFAR